MKEKINNVKAGPLTADTNDCGYLVKWPTSIPSGCVLVHNDVRSTRRLGSRGFRAWFSKLNPSKYEPCHCGVTELPHFRVKGLPHLPDTERERVKHHLRTAPILSIEPNVEGQKLVNKERKK
jgi:hypothetical protein